ncbi:hypothetical protein LPJ72_004777, partial [Coemansia sp. Benny D160-2]
MRGKYQQQPPKQQHQHQHQHQHHHQHQALATSALTKSPQRHHEEHDPNASINSAAGIGAGSVAGPAVQVPGSTIIKAPLSNTLPSPMSPAKPALLLGRDSTAATSSDGLSQSQLMKPVSHMFVSSQPQAEHSSSMSPSSNSAANAPARYLPPNASGTSNPSLPSLLAPHGGSLHHSHTAAASSFFTESSFRRNTQGATSLPPAPFVSHQPHMQPRSSTSLLAGTDSDVMAWPSLPS